MKMIGIVMMIVGLSFAACECEFSKWTTLNNKVYASSSEFNHRKAIFFDNLAKIQEHNSQSGQSYSLGVNEFTDLTYEEFASKYLMTPQQVAPAGRAVESVGTINPIDWRDKKAVTAVKDQKSCGSCYAFSAAGAYESVLYLEKGVLTDLSPGQCAYCSKTYGNNACNGGLPYYCFNYYRDYGIEKEIDYPYVDHNEGCKYDKTKVFAHNTGYAKSAVNSETALQQQVMLNPVSVCIYASSSFQMYSKGILVDTRCPNYTINHAVIVVGQGHDDSSNQDYYIVKNSWGAAWGESGYIRMAANHNNMCAIASQVTWPTGLSLA